MARRKNDDGWGIALGVTIGALLLYYLQTGVGKENDAALIPNSLEGKIDSLVATLNQTFGKRWVDIGLYELKSYLQDRLPAPLVKLIDTVSSVELISRRIPMISYAKQQLAVQKALAQ